MCTAQRTLLYSNTAKPKLSFRHATLNSLVWPLQLLCVLGDCRRPVAIRSTVECEMRRDNSRNRPTSIPTPMHTLQCPVHTRVVSRTVLVILRCQSFIPSRSHMSDTRRVNMPRCWMVKVCTRCGNSNIYVLYKFTLHYKRRTMPWFMIHDSWRCMINV